MQRLLWCVLVVAGCASEPSPALIVAPDSVAFPAFVLGPDPFLVQVSGASGSAWTASTLTPWLRVVPGGGASLPAQVNLLGDAGGLGGGVHAGVVRFTVDGTELLLPVTIDVPSLSGPWTATVPGGTLNLTLDDAHGSVTGTGAIVSAASVQPVIVTGSHGHPTASLALNATGFQTATLAVAFTGAATLAGTISGSGFTGDVIALTRP